MLSALLDAGTVVLCAGGGGVQVVRDDRTGRLRGVEAVVDKDLAAAVLAQALGMDTLLLLTDVPAVMAGFGTPAQRAIGTTTPDELRAERFPAGSMGPKVDAACRFVEVTGGTAMIGALDAAPAMLRGEAGTVVTPGPPPCGEPGTLVPSRAGRAR